MSTRRVTVPAVTTARVSPTGPIAVMMSLFGKYFENSDIITAIGPVGETRAVVTAGTVTRRVDIYGITPSFVAIKGRKTSEGRFIGVADVQDKSSVCVLGLKLKQQLFGGD